MLVFIVSNGKNFNLKKPLLKDEDSGKKNLLMKFVWSNSKKNHTRQIITAVDIRGYGEYYTNIVSIVAYFIVLREIVLSSRENFAGLRSSFFLGLFVFFGEAVWT